MPNDYITRRNALNAACSDCYCCETIDEFEDTTCPVKQKFMSIPAADVERVKHGRWIPINRSNPLWAQMGIAQHKCSECGSEEVIARKLCPECGAKMDDELPKGEDDDNKNL